jgi:CDP-glycerol glycerophosphotransferase
MTATVRGIRLGDLKYWKLRQAVARTIIRLFVQYLPARDHAVVTGSPDEEGNSVEIVRGLAGRIPVYWLLNGPPTRARWLLSGVDDADSIFLVSKRSVAGFLAYATARYVFFTHGLYTSPPPPKHKIFVNLWHGDGPKRRKHEARIASTLVVSGTRLWGQNKLRTFGLDKSRLLLTGNPRVDQFSRPTSDDGMLRLGLDPTKPLVLWLPTYRGTRFERSRVAGIADWIDVAALSNAQPVRDEISVFAQIAAARGVALAVKPHGLDADEFASTVLHTITNAALYEAGTGTYQLLARASGLITDYSSIWTDFLALDRPIGFYCPDMAEYVSSRGLNVDDLPGLLPGPLLETSGDFEAFVLSCLHEPDDSRQRRAESVQRIGAETRLGAAARVLDEVLSR